MVHKFQCSILIPPYEREDTSNYYNFIYFKKMFLGINVIYSARLEICMIISISLKRRGGNHVDFLLPSKSGDDKYTYLLTGQDVAFCSESMMFELVESTKYVF
jgi:hypothetical protein